MVIDLCPRADVSDTLLGTPITLYRTSQSQTNSIELNGKTYNKTVSGYLSARLHSHDMKSFGVEQFLTLVHKSNQHIPESIYLSLSSSWWRLSR